MVIVILGPTASGKTQLATQLAFHIDAEIISADSRQVYRGMTIGTGKDLDEYTVEGKNIPYHLIDSVDAGEKYNVSQFQQDVAEAITDIESRSKVPLLCGGSGLYIQAVLSNHQFTSVPVDEAVRAELEGHSHGELVQILHEIPSEYSTLADTSTRKRTIRAIEIARYLRANPHPQLPEPKPLEYTIFGLNPPTELRRKRITRRLLERLKNGLVEEVKGLLEQGISAEQLIYYGLEYKFVTRYLQGSYSYDEMVSKLETEIHRFAKRQMTYFRKMERDGLPIHWLDNSHRPDQWLQTILSTLHQPGFPHE